MDPLVFTFFLDPTTIAGTAGIQYIYHSCTISSNVFTSLLTDTSDYVALSAFGTNPLAIAQFGDSLRRFCFDVTIIDDTQFELSETFNVTIELSFDSPTSGIVVDPAEAVITILDDDGKSTVYSYPSLMLAPTILSVSSSPMP